MWGDINHASSTGSNTENLLHITHEEIHTEFFLIYIWFQTLCNSTENSGSISNLGAL